MADKASVRTGFDTLVAENWSSTVIDTLANTMPLAAIFFGRNGTKKGATGIGIPDSGALTTGMKQAKLKRAEILSGTIYQPMIHHLLPADSDGKVMAFEDNNPAVDSWEANGPEKRFKRPSVKWCEIVDPAKVSKERMDHTKSAAAGERNGWEAIGSLLRVERDDRLTRHVQRWNQLLWGTYTGTASGTTTAGYPTDEDAEKWNSIHSLQQAIHDSNTYCGVDRTVTGNSFWKGNRITTATAPNFRDMIRAAKLTMVLPDGTKGLSSKGVGLDLMVVGGTLFNYALAEAESRQAQPIMSGTPIPAFGQFGFQNDIVKIDNTWIILDPECPDGHVAGLNPATWTYAVHPTANFAQSTPTYQGDIEGGDRAWTWTISTKQMLVCEAPMFNVYWTNVA